MVTSRAANRRGRTVFGRGGDLAEVCLSVKAVKVYEASLGLWVYIERIESNFIEHSIQGIKKSMNHVLFRESW